jgi:hypothetical protein
MTQIENHFGIVLPVSVMLEADTPRKLAVLIGQATKDNTPAGCLVALRRSGEGPPVFCVHAYLGDVGYSLALAAALGSARPFYGLRAVGLQSNEIPLPTVKSIAQRYLSEIRTVQPHGPYLLGGACAGAVIATEMAHQLRQAGETVSGLVMIDPVPHLHYSPWLASSSTVTSLYRLRGAFRLVRSQLIARHLEKSGDERRHLVYKSLQAAVALYQPQPYSGSALLVYSEEFRDGLLGKGRFSSLYPQMRTAAVGHMHGAALSQDLEETGRIVREYFDEVCPLASAIN